MDQRQHKNFLEQLTILVFSILVSGLVYPQLTIALAAIHFLGRILFTIGYRISPRARMIGMPFVMLTTFGLMGTVLVASFKMSSFVWGEPSLWSIDL